MKKNRIDFSLFALVCGLLLINLPLFLDKVLPYMDTFGSFQHFYVTYNELFFNKEFPLWLPFASYGTQGDVFLISWLSPFEYFAGFIGLIFRIENVYLLFKLSLFAEQLALLLGIYLLCRTLFKNKTTVLFVCINVIGTISLMYNIYLGFRMFYLLPMLFYFIVMFFKQYRPRHLILAMIIFSMQGIGIGPYLMVIPLLIMSIIFISLLAGKYKEWRFFLKITKRDVVQAIALFFIFVVISGSYFYFIAHALDSADLVAPGRTEGTGRVNMETFLSYGGFTDLEKFIELVFPYYSVIPISKIRGSIDIKNISFFIGIMPLFFAACLIYYLITRKKKLTPFVLSLLITVVVLGLFSLGKKGLVAVLLYYIFPGMKYYRHIGYVVNLYKILIPLLAGYGLDYFLEGYGQKPDTTGISRHRYIILSSALIACSMLYTSVSFMGWPELLSLPFLIIFFTAAGIVLFYRWRVNSGKTFLTRAAIFIIVFEMCCLQLLVSFYSYNDNVSRDVTIDREVMKVSGWKFVNGRKYMPPDFRTFESTRFSILQRPLEAGTMNFAQWDPCNYTINAKDYWLVSQYPGGLIPLRIDVINTYVNLLIANATGDIDTFYEGSCASPKLNLMSDVLFVNNLQDAVNEVRGGVKLRDLLVLNNVPEDLKKSWAEERNKIHEGVMQVTDFRANGLDLDVVLPEGSASWLLYTDAYHPKWRAYINGSPAYLAQANIAFKAVKLGGGINHVRFVFDNRSSAFCIYIFAATGIVFMLVVIAGFLYLLKQPQRGS